MRRRNGAGGPRRYHTVTSNCPFSGGGPVRAPGYLAPTAIAAIPAARVSHSPTCPTIGCRAGLLAVIGRRRGGASAGIAARAPPENDGTEAPREDASRCDHG